MRKKRTTITVDADLLEGAGAQVAEGQARSMSEWVSDAIAERLERARKLKRLGELIEEYEADHGVITDEERAEQAQSDREEAAFWRARAQRSA